MEPLAAPSHDPGGSLWYVTVTVAGQSVPAEEIRAGLERLAHEHPFLLSGRFDVDRAEVRYWEEAPDARYATDLALALWTDHRHTAGLPDWQVVGVEVIDRETFHRRGRHLGPGLIAAGGVTPF